MQIRNLKIGPIGSIVLLIVVIFLCKPGFVEGASIVRTDKGIYNQGEMIRVRFSNAPGYNSDWICIVPAGSPDTEPGDYKYTPRGVGQGSLMFDPRAPGRYEVRAYYNYRRNGYAVSGRYPFSVGSVAVQEEAVIQRMEPVEPINPIEADFPPPIPFDVPPNVVVLPGTDVYVVPDSSADIYFQGGWWWRQWRGNWYRSQFHDHGWARYHEYPAWHRRIPHDWRHSYSNHIWGGRPWNPPHINHSNLNNHWRGGHWRTNHGLGRPNPVPHGGQTLHGGGRPGGGPEKPAVRTGGPGSGRPGGGPEKPAVRAVGPGSGRPGGGPEKPAVRAVSPGSGRSGGGPEKPVVREVGPGSGRSGGSPEKPAVRAVAPGSGTHPNTQTKQGHGNGPGRGDPR
jgi:hypothetical protein